MPCTWVKVGDTHAMVCSRGRRRKCAFCSQTATLQCDHPKRKGTCDKPLCDRCAVSRGPNVDWCPSHKQEELFTHGRADNLV